MVIARIRLKELLAIIETFPRPKVLYTDLLKVPL